MKRKWNSRPAGQRFVIVFVGISILFAIFFVVRHLVRKAAGLVRGQRFFWNRRKREEAQAAENPALPGARGIQAAVSAPRPAGIPSATPNAGPARLNPA